MRYQTTKSGKIINQANVRFTQAEQKALQREVHRYNERVRTGSLSGDRLSASLQQFENRQQFRRFMEKIEKRAPKRGAQKPPAPPPTVNRYGVEFTAPEVDKFKKAVDKINKRAEDQREKMAKIPLKSAGKLTGGTVGDLLKMGAHPDMLFQKFSASLDQFEDKDAFKQALKKLRHVGTKKYVTERIDAYIENYIAAGYTVLGDDFEEVEEVIRGMSPAKFYKLAISDEALEIGFIYYRPDIKDKINRIVAALKG